MQERSYTSCVSKQNLERHPFVPENRDFADGGDFWDGLFSSNRLSSYNSGTHSAMNPAHNIPQFSMNTLAGKLGVEPRVSKFRAWRVADYTTSHSLSKLSLILVKHLYPHILVFVVWMRGNQFFVTLDLVAS